MEIYGLFKSHRAVQEALAKLRAEGFLKDRISVIGPGEEVGIHGLLPSKVEISQEERIVEASAAAGAATGLAGLAASAGVAVGTVTLLASGPILLALPLALWGAAMSGFIGYTLSQGVSLNRAETYAERVRQGETLVIFHASGEDEAAVARRNLEMAGAEEVFCTQGPQESAVDAGGN